jgi:uncharacterized damage-inducible protein DinB
VADRDKKEIESVLQDGMDALAGAVHGIDEETACLRPQPDAWSVLECVEHVALVETGLLARLKEAKPAGASHEDRAREARFRELAMNRLRRIEAPERAVPKRECQTLAKAVEEFRAARSQTVRFVQEFDGDLRSWLTSHPLITRPVNCYEMLLLMAFHPARHSQQIVEIREQLSRVASLLDTGTAS